jgi:hypothetical protein
MLRNGFCVFGLVLLAAPGWAGEGPPAGGCCAPEGCLKTVCRPTTDVKTQTKRVYTDVKEEFCLPCSCLGALFHRCGDCSKVYHRKIMVVKIRKCDVPVKKCVPVLESPYPAGCRPSAPCDAAHPPAASLPVLAPSAARPAGGGLYLDMPAHR